MCSAAPRTFNKLWKFPKHKYPCWTASRTPCSRDQGDEWIISIRGGVQKKRFFWEIFPKCGWVGWLIPKQDPNPSKHPHTTPKITILDPNFTFRFPKSHKNPGVCGWENRFRETYPKNGFIFGRLPLTQRSKIFWFLKKKKLKEHWSHVCCASKLIWFFLLNPNVGATQLVERIQVTVSDIVQAVVFTLV